MNNLTKFIQFTKYYSERVEPNNKECAHCNFKINQMKGFKYTNGIK